MEQVWTSSPAAGTYTLPIMGTATCASFWARPDPHSPRDGDGSVAHVPNKGLIRFVGTEARDTGPVGETGGALLGPATSRISPRVP